MPICAALAAIAIVAAVGLVSFGPANRQVAPLRIAINTWPGYEFAALAEELGYFEEEGVEVELVDLSSLGDCRRAFERGQVDGLFSTVVELLMCERSGVRDSQVVLVADYSNGGDLIVAGEGIESVADLAHKRVAVEPQSLNEILLLRALDSAGRGRQDVEVVWMPALSMPRAFAEGEVDAAVTYPPTSLDLQAAGAVRIFDSSAIPNVILDTLAVDPAVADERSDEVEGLRRAFFRAQEYADTHPDHAMPIMGARHGLNGDEFEEALSDGILILREADQARFLDAGGELERTLQTLRGDLEVLANQRVGSAP